MLIKVKTIEELKQEFIISLRNNCGDKITKVSDLSVTNGIAYGLSKIVQKINKNAAQIESKLFPEKANSTALDDIASRQGIPSRRGASASSVVLLFKATPATVYPINTQVQTPSGIVFTTQAELVINSNGYGFVLGNSTTTGQETNVNANNITILNGTPPAGHESVTNPVKAINGRDIESDYDFRKRLINAEHILSRNTEAFYEALILNDNEEVLRVFTRGSDAVNKAFELILVRNNLGEFSAGELSDIKDGIINNLPLSDKNTTKVNVKNVEFQYIDLYVPLQLKSGYTLDEVIVNIQIEMTTFLDLRKWEFGEKVEWDDLLQICKEAEGVKTVIDKDFSPRIDIQVDSKKLPRLRAFTIKDVDTDTTVGEAFTNSFWIKDNSENAIYSDIIN